jgi:uncharacterized membrane protein
MTKSIILIAVLVSMIGFCIGIWLLIICQNIVIEEQEVDKLMGQNFKH